MVFTQSGTFLRKGVSPYVNDDMYCELLEEGNITGNFNKALASRYSIKAYNSEATIIF